MSEFNEMYDLDSYVWFHNTYSENILEASKKVVFSN